MSDVDIKEAAPTGRGGYRPNAGRKKKVAQADAYTLLAEAKAKREIIRAQKEELDYQARLGELLDATEVRETWAAHILEAKSVLLALPARVAPIVLGMTEIRDVEDAIREEINLALSRLTKGEDGTKA